MRSYKILPPTYLFIAVVIIVILHVLLPVATLIPSPWTLLGIIPLAVGIIFAVRAEQTFREANTAVNPFDAPSTLVTVGLYRFTRNPMYLGSALMLFGASILLGSLTPYIIVIAFALLIDRTFIRMEEQRMASTFGTQYEEYKSRVRRWL
ncbi:MAG TPA: isoprenylcysteine carboxylmethyltransferase family protein [Anaerolineales bacterium]|nr:isoprenylcysteine carboxylmethyltransferase family protein [Anaerolineales bacterium]